MTPVVIGVQKNCGMTFHSRKGLVKPLTFDQRMYQSLKRKGLAPQFEHAGIYAILLDGNIVYIGKSVNMLQRMA